MAEALASIRQHLPTLWWAGKVNRGRGFLSHRWALLGLPGVLTDGTLVLNDRFWKTNKEKPHKCVDIFHVDEIYFIGKKPLLSFWGAWIKFLGTVASERESLTLRVDFFLIICWAVPASWSLVERRQLRDPLTIGLDQKESVFKILGSGVAYYRLDTVHCPQGGHSAFLVCKLQLIPTTDKPSARPHQASYNFFILFCFLYGRGSN